MSDEDEMEDFDVNDEDIRHAMNYSSYRKKGRKTREDAMLGVFASRGDSDEDSDGNFKDDGDEDLLKRFKFKESNATKKSGLINFVSKGTKEKKEKKEPVIVDTYVSTEDESDLEERVDLEDKSDREDSRENLKTKTENVAVDIEKLKPVQNMSGPTFLKSKNSSKKTSASLNKHEVKEVGNWEKYEKGFGSKMLLKMGWQKGLGLGKELHGRAVPVEAVVRKGKGAVGRYGAESKDLIGKMVQDEEVGEGSERAHVSRWKDKGAKGLKYESVRTAEELLAVGAGNQKKLRKAEMIIDGRKGIDNDGSAVMSRMKIIDMTGREQKILNSFDGLSTTSQVKKQSHFDLLELTKNLEMLVDMTEQKIIHSEKKLKHFDDTIVSLEYDESRNRERLKVEKDQIEKVEALMTLVERCQSLLDSESELKTLMNVFIELKINYPDEFIVFNLHELAIPLFGPVLKQKMAIWRPFDPEEPNSDLIYCYELFADLRELFIDLKGVSVNPFNRLLWDTWMVVLRKQLQEHGIRACTERCVELMGRWSRLVPKFMMDNILEKMILVKLVWECEAWDPLSDVVPIHIWVHPWLPLLKERMDSELFPMIRMKLASALTAWHPSDVSAKAILLPWRPPVFSTGSWDSFISRNIIPKLESILSDELIISPSDQSLQPLNWVLSWYELAPITSLATIFDRSFFPKWLNSLSMWLSASPNYQEVSQWYIGWKTLFPSNLIQQPVVKARLSQALIMMNRSVSGGPNIDNVSAYKEPSPQVPLINKQSPQFSSGVQVQSASTAKVTSFRDIIEKKAAEYNLLFLPVANRFSKSGQQVYRFGNLNVYIEKNVVFMLLNGSWVPTSLNEIVAKAY